MLARRLKPMGVLLSASVVSMPLKVSGSEDYSLHSSVPAGSCYRYRVMSQALPISHRILPGVG